MGLALGARVSAALVLTLVGLAGNDVLDGGDGNDSIVAGNGDDIVRGQPVVQEAPFRPDAARTWMRIEPVRSFTQDRQIPRQGPQDACRLVLL